MASRGRERHGLREGGQHETDQLGENSCATGCGARSEIRVGPRKGDRFHVHQLRPPPGTRSRTPFACTGGSRASRAALAQAHLAPPSASRPGLGIRLQRQPLLRHRHGHDPQRARSQPSGTALSSKRLRTAPDHTSSISPRCALQSPRHGILAGDRGVFGCRDSGVAHRAAAGPAAGSRTASCTPSGPTPLAWGGRQGRLNEVGVNGFCPAKRSRRARWNKQGSGRLSRRQRHGERWVVHQIRQLLVDAGSGGRSRVRRKRLGSPSRSACSGRCSAWMSVIEGSRAGRHRPATAGTA